MIGLDQHNLRLDPDEFVIRSADSDHERYGRVGLIEICTSSGGRGLDLVADDISQIMDGIYQLAQRKDIEMGEMRFDPDDPRGASVMVRDFCYLAQGDS